MDAKRRAAIAQLVADALVEKKRDQNHNHRIIVCGQQMVAHEKDREADAIMQMIDFKNQIRKAVERVIRSLT